MRDELTALSNALTATLDFERWDGKIKAEARQKDLQVQIGRLVQHETWLQTQRKTVSTAWSDDTTFAQVKALEPTLVENKAALVLLDHGGFYDSAGGKVSAWAATFITVPKTQHSVVLFFNGSKDADHGIGLGGSFSIQTAIRLARPLRSAFSPMLTVLSYPVTLETAFAAMICCCF